jgi:lipopolysaccharide transport system ATP-binding protein
MSSDIAIEVECVSKVYQIYDRPQDRLKQMLASRIRRAFGKPPRPYFKEHWALRDVSLHVRHGETVGIIGRNGSGKSTLLQIICGTLTASVGRVVARGRIGALLELGAGFNAEFTGRENAVLNAQILGLLPQEIAERIREIEAFADIGAFFDRPMKTYSSGMTVRVAFAVQSCIDPDILIVDEALAVGDAPFQAKCMRRLEELKARGTSILFVSHDTGSVRTLCDRAIWLDRGEVQAAGEVVPVTSAYLSAVFGSATAASAGAPELALPEQGVQADEVQGGLGVASKPLSAWGTHPGLIRSVEMRDEEDRPSFAFSGNGTVHVAIRFALPHGLEATDISVALAVKTLAGTELLVKLTEPGRIARETDPAAGEHVVEFSFPNLLNTGRYMLAVAIQRGGAFDPVYLEHIEGVAYFQSTQPPSRLGLFLAPIETRIASVASTVAAGGDG